MSLEVKGLNKAEFIQIFDKLYEPVRNFIYYKCGDIQLAEDISQDAFLKVWEKRDEVKKESVKAFLYTIANNLLINRFEHQKVTLKFASNFNSSELSSSPEFEMEMKEFDHKLQRALNNLDEKNRSVFLMNRIDGLTYAQISESLGLTVKAIEKRMEKALSSLRKTISANI